MSPFRSYRLVAVLVITSLLLVAFASVALANDGTIARPIPVVGPRLNPPAIPHTSVLNPAQIINTLPVPVQISEAAATYAAQPYYSPGAGVIKTVTQHANGLTLYPAQMACNDFNTAREWASQALPLSDIWTDSYAGWLPFAVNDGFRQAKNLTFSVERVVGPGANYGTGYSAKIASNQPYAGGFGSPMITVTPGAEVIVTAKYLIWDYVQAVDPGTKVKDWASMGVKADAAGHDAQYVNGFVRGEWAQMSTTVTAGHSGKIMVLLQGESIGAVNSNIYFDDIQIQVNGQYIGNCLYE